MRFGALSWDREKWQNRETHGRTVRVGRSVIDSACLTDLVAYWFSLTDGRNDWLTNGLTDRWKRLTFSLNTNKKKNTKHLQDIFTHSNSFVFCLNFQAFNSGHSDGEGHKMNIYKSCVIMAGIYVFFLVECTMKARLAGRKRSQEDLHMCDEVTSPDKMVNSWWWLHKQWSVKKALFV